MKEKIEALGIAAEKIKGVVRNITETGHPELFKLDTENY